MSADDSYFTLCQPSTGSLREKGSRFLAYAWPVTSEEQIKSHLAGLRREHPAARHHCYAWRLGADKSRYRANDDGEPPNSAGKPILSVVQGHNLSDVLIAVVRYFGGTLLGVNGLINAYRGAAMDAMQHAQLQQCYPMQAYSASFAADQMNTVMRVLRQYTAQIVQQDYHTEFVLTFRVRKQQSRELEEEFSKLYTIELKQQ